MPAQVQEQKGKSEGENKTLTNTEERH